MNICMYLRVSVRDRQPFSGYIHLMQTLEYTFSVSLIPFLYQNNFYFAIFFTSIRMNTDFYFLRNDYSKKNIYARIYH